MEEKKKGKLVQWKGGMVNLVKITNLVREREGLK